MAGSGNSPRNDARGLTIAIEKSDKTQGQKATLIIEIHVDDNEAERILAAVERHSAESVKNNKINGGGQTFQTTINSGGSWTTLMGNILQLVQVGDFSVEEEATTEASGKDNEDGHREHRLDHQTASTKLSAELVSAVEEHRQALKEQVQALKEEVEALKEQTRFQEQYVELLERRVLGLRARVSPS